MLPVAVEADGGALHEMPRPDDAAVAYAVLLLSGPTALGDVLAGQVYDPVHAVDRFRRRRTLERVPLHGPHPAAQHLRDTRSAAAGGDHLVAAFEQGAHDVPADESGGSSDGDLHASSFPSCFTRNSVERWARQGSNLDSTDYESAALPFELRAHLRASLPRCVG